MSILEAGKALGSRCIISVKQRSEIFKLLDGNDSVIPAYITLDGEVLNLHIFFGDDIIAQIGEETLQKLGAFHVEDSYMMKVPIEGELENKVVSQLMTEPMVVTNHVCISEGWIVLDLRFHGSRYKRVSSILSQHLGKTRNISLLYLGTSPGLPAVLSSLNDRIPLSLVIFEAPVPRFEEAGATFARNPELIEVENSLLIEGRVKALSYLMEPGDSYFTVNEDYIDNSLLADIRRRSNENSIVRYGSFMKRFGDYLRFMVILPTSQLGRYLTTVFSIAENEGSSTLTLIAASPFGFDIMETFA